MASCGELASFCSLFVLVLGFSHYQVYIGHVAKHMSCQLHVFCAGILCESVLDWCSSVQHYSCNSIGHGVSRSHSWWSASNLNASQTIEEILTLCCYNLIW